MNTTENISIQKEIELLLIIQKKWISILEKRDRTAVSEESETGDYYP
jgi:hypothetical protein